MRGHAFIAEMNPGAFQQYALDFALQAMAPLKPDAKSRLQQNNHPDYLRVYPDGNAVKIGQVRDIISEISKKPYEGSKRLIAIFDAESMTTQAQNALLKSLEEPLAGNIFLLLCESHNRLLPTILSRCALLRVGSSEQQQLSEQQQQLRKHTLDTLVKLLQGGEATQLCVQLPEDKQEFLFALDMMGVYFSDAMHISAGNDNIENIDYNNSLKEWRGKNPRSAALCADLCRKAVTMAEANVSLKLCAQWLYIKIAEVIG